MPLPSTLAVHRAPSLQSMCTQHPCLMWTASPGLWCMHTKHPHVASGISLATRDPWLVHAQCPQCSMACFSQPMVLMHPASSCRSHPTGLGLQPCIHLVISQGLWILDRRVHVPGTLTGSSRVVCIFWTMLHMHPVHLCGSQPMAHTPPVPSHKSWPVGLGLQLLS